MFKHYHRFVSAVLICILLSLAGAGCTGKNVNPSNDLSKDSQSDLQTGREAEKGGKEAVQSSEGKEAGAESGVEAAGQSEAAAVTLSPADNEISDVQWQGVITFPDWKGYTDDTLAMNHMYSFFGYHGQGSLRIYPAARVTGFNLYVNNVLVDTSEVAGGRQYDLDISSLTKMFSVNYALQKLVTDEQISLDAKIIDFLGEDFAEDTMIVPSEKGETPEADLDQIKMWKGEVTIRDLLRHQGGFPADPKYSSPLLYKKDLAEGESYPENQLFAGNTPGEETRQATIDMICRTPLWYEPGTKTVYSDVDYMILGLVVEQVTGEDLNSWLREVFWEPMGLTHITYNPLRNGFAKEDCAATELTGNRLSDK